MRSSQSTPAAFGYKPVPEWETNVACWSAWPYDAVAWGGFIEAAQREFVGFCRALAAEPGSEPLALLVPDAEVEAQARAALEGLSKHVAFHTLAYGDIWLRDTTPLFLRNAHGAIATVRFRFNGWGDKYIYPGDVELSARLSTHVGSPQFAFDTVLEGGAVEFDGAGTCLTTTSCLLNPNRGEALTREGIDAVLAQAFGVDKVLWLQEGLAGDHTDGHIDNIARFVAPGVVMTTRSSDRSDPNYDVYEAIHAQLASSDDAAGRRLRVLTVPSPGLVAASNGEPLAASHLNFYIGNRVVVVPAFGGPSDEPARQVIAAAFPDRRVTLSPARTILEYGGGTFHCMTRQQPGSQS